MWRRGWRWISRNKLATVLIAAVTWVAHRVIETAVLNIGRFAGIPIPMWV